MFKKYQILIIVVALVLLNVFLGLRFRHLRENTNIVLRAAEQKIEATISLNNKLIFLINNTHLSESTQLNKNIVLQNIIGDGQIKLNELLINSPLLILRFVERSCSACVEQTLSRIKELPQELLPQKFIIIASNSNARSLRSFMKKNDIKFPVYVVEDDALSVPLEKHKFPYIFILDTHAKATNIFYPLTSYPEFTNDYFKVTQKKFPDLFYQNGL